MRASPTEQRSLTIALILAFRALRCTSGTTALSIVLVAVSVVATTGSHASFQALSDAIQGLSADGEVAAEVHIAGCRTCRVQQLRSESHARQMDSSVSMLDVSFVTRLRVRAVGKQAIRPRFIDVVCLAFDNQPTTVTWQSSAARRRWFEHAADAGVLLGDDLWPENASSAADLVIMTDIGRLSVDGRMKRRALLGTRARLNNAMIVPQTPSFAALCANGIEEWRVVARDSIGFQQRVEAFEDGLRTMLHLRPGGEAPYRLHGTDRFAKMVQQLVKKTWTWLQIVPLSIALLCAAGVFAVNALDATTRVHEFGVMRSVGGTRKLLLLQLFFEASGIAVVGAGAALILLGVAGILHVNHVNDVAPIFTGIGVAFSMTVAGVLIPGIAAAREPAISSLENHGVG